MLQTIVIGNLGADAKIQESNGHKFISISVAHSERFKDQAGNAHERTQWVRCAINGDGGNLLQYLVKGARVCVIGRLRVGTFSSEKERRIVASIDIDVDRIELIGSKPDEVPAMLYDAQGLGFNVQKYYFIVGEQLKSLNIKKGKTATLQTPNGRQFLVSDIGQVSAVINESDPQPSTTDNAEVF